MEEVERVPDKEEQEIVDIFEPYGMTKATLQPLLNVLKADKNVWVDFMVIHTLT